VKLLGIPAATCPGRHRRRIDGIEIGNIPCAPANSMSTCLWCARSSYLDISASRNTASDIF